MAGGAATRQHRGMTGTGGRRRVGIVTIREPCSVFLQTAKTAVDKERLPALDVIAAHLIENDQHQESRFLVLGPERGGTHDRESDQRKTKTLNNMHGSWLQEQA